MTVSTLMKRHNIERIVYLSERDTFHAWPEDGLHDVNLVGRGPTVESAIHDAVARRERLAA